MNMQSRFRGFLHVIFMFWMKVKNNYMSTVSWAFRITLAKKHVLTYLLENKITWVVSCTKCPPPAPVLCYCQYGIEILKLDTECQMRVQKGFSFSLFFQVFGIGLLSNFGRRLPCNLHLLLLALPIILSLSAEERTSPKWIWVFLKYSHIHVQSKGK